MMEKSSILDEIDEIMVVSARGHAPDVSELLTQHTVVIQLYV